MTWAESLLANYTDGILVLHRGRIVHERYFGALDEAGQHAAMSMTKSLTGLLADLPEAVLGAIVIVAVVKLVRLGEIVRMYRESPAQTMVAAGTLVFQ